MTKIKLLVLDFDGVFTDGHIYFDSENNIIKKYNVKDGMGLNNLKKANIKIWIISGFKPNSSQENICKHLDVDFYVFGVSNKLEFLKNRLQLENINKDNVAYMGDDINDVDCLSYVYLSGCPKNAHDSCKQICNFISTKNGGDGCVRELCDYILEETKHHINIIDQIKLESLYQLNNINIPEIIKISDIILKKNDTNNIYILGVGKSQNIARHTCNILNSININCFLLDPLNCNHGDIGLLNKNDLIICYSKSGNTKEIIEILPSIKNKECQILGVCCHNESKFNIYCDDVFVLPFNNEIINPNNINCIPGNSIISFVYFTNILTYYLIKKSNLQLEVYKLNHPAGNIGNNLKQIKEVIITTYPKLVLINEIKLNTILLEMTELKIGCCFFVDNNDDILGILTDGDIRRILIKNNNIKKININDINKNFYYETDINKYVNDCKKKNYFPVLEKKKIIGIIKL